MFFMSVVQIDTKKCFYCPQKDVSLVPKELLFLADQTFLRTSTLMLVRVQFATFVLALHAPVCSSIGVLQAHCHQPPKLVDSGLQVPLFVSGAATSLLVHSAFFPST
jgi:hypothetical protein